MTKRTLNDLEREMRSVVRGERKVPPAPVKTAFMDVLSPTNVEMIQLIAKRQPTTVSHLAELMGRAQSNVSRSLQILEHFGIIELVRKGKSVRPVLKASKVSFDLVRGTMTLSPETSAAE